MDWAWITRLWAILAVGEVGALYVILRIYGIRPSDLLGWCVATVAKIVGK